MGKGSINITGKNVQVIPQFLKLIDGAKTMICLLYTSYLLGWFFMKFGYRLGKDAVMKLMKSGMINTIITGASILGLFMMGALSSSYVKVTTPLKFVMTVSYTHLDVYKRQISQSQERSMPMRMR